MRLSLSFHTHTNFFFLSQCQFTEWQITVRWCVNLIIFCQTCFYSLLLFVVHPARARYCCQNQILEINLFEIHNNAVLLMHVCCAAAAATDAYYMTRICWYINIILTTSTSHIYTTYTHALSHIITRSHK